MRSRLDEFNFRFANFLIIIRVLIMHLNDLKNSKKVWGGVDHVALEDLCWVYSGSAINFIETVDYP